MFWESYTCATRSLGPGALSTSRIVVAHLRDTKASVLGIPNADSAARAPAASVTVSLAAKDPNPTTLSNDPGRCQERAVNS